MGKQSVSYKKTRIKAVGAMLLCVLFWGLSFVSIKVTVKALPPMSQAAFRYVFALFFLFVFKLIKERRQTALNNAPREKLKKRDLPLLISSSVAGVSLYFFFENNGVRRINAGEASIIVSVVPVLSMLAGRVIFKTKIFARQWAGAFISVIGVFLVSKSSFAVSGKPAGYFFMALASALWVAYCFLTEPLFKRASRFYIVFWQSVFGFLGLAPFVFFEPVIWENITVVVIANLAFLGLFCSAIGYIFYAYAMNVLGVPVTSMFINMIPVVSCAGGFFILDERLLPLQAAGALLIICGVYLAAKGE